MAGTRQICVVCEGKSEVVYLSLLTRLLGRLSQDRGDVLPPVAFAGKPPGRGVGTGEIDKVRASFERERRKSPRTAFSIWTDADLAVREAAESPEKFRRHLPVLRGGKNGQPPFSMSPLNFEDFLAMHFDSGLYAEWKEAFRAAGHFTRPLHAEQYLPVFRPFWERSAGKNAGKYQKGALPADWLGECALRNLFRHCADPEVLASVRAVTPSPTFGEYLRDVILPAFPELNPDTTPCH